jgi:dihydroxy-acid dehydratase
LVEEGDTIEIDIPQRSITLAISDTEMTLRAPRWRRKAKILAACQRERRCPPHSRAYAAMTTSADNAVRDVAQV